MKLFILLTLLVPTVGFATNLDSPKNMVRGHYVRDAHSPKSCYGGDLVISDFKGEPIIKLNTTNFISLKTELVFTSNDDPRCNEHTTTTLSDEGSSSVLNSEMNIECPGKPKVQISVNRWTFTPDHLEIYEKADPYTAAKTCFLNRVP